MALVNLVHSFQRLRPNICTPVPKIYTTADSWTVEAENHVAIMDELLYPSGISSKAKMHAVSQHPIYNFIHTYYKFSANELKRYSPGINIEILAPHSCEKMTELLHEKFLIQDDSDVGTCWKYGLISPMKPDGRYGWISLCRNRNILAETVKRAASFACFGLHEWAMLYSNRSSGVDGQSRHQEHLPMRVSQSVIDDTVENLPLRCTHFDAWRFFHPAAQPLNLNNPMSRHGQPEFEQPGCVHAAMDLFKFAYQLYPLVSAELLQDTLRIAITARIIDMRASPYDVSRYAGCEMPLAIETLEGRKLYVEAQEQLAAAALPLRQKLLKYYDDVLTIAQRDSTLKAS